MTCIKNDFSNIVVGDKDSMINTHDHYWEIIQRCLKSDI